MASSNWHQVIQRLTVSNDKKIWVKAKRGENSCGKIGEEEEQEEEKEEENEEEEKKEKQTKMKAAQVALAGAIVVGFSLQLIHESCEANYSEKIWLPGCHMISDKGSSEKKCPIKVFDDGFSYF